jgi:oleate hydratase
VHVLDSHIAFGGAIQTSGDSKGGYVLHTGAKPYLQEQCVKDLLQKVPSPAQDDKNKTLWDFIKEHEWYTRPINQAHTRAIRKTEDGSCRVDTHKLRIGRKLRMDLIRFILNNERSFDSKKINEVFEPTFFESEFWALWSTT